MKKIQGFTLMELLTVIAIIIILAGFLTPALNRARRQARRVECINNLKQIGIALNSYALDYDGLFPGKLSDLTVNYLGSQGALLNCTEAYKEYDYKKDLTVSNTANTPIAWCPEAKHLEPNQYNVLYLDGHVGAANEEPK